MGDEEEIAWLVQHTGQSREEVERGLVEGRLRRRAVVEELVEAGLEGEELLEMVARLTGLPRPQARKLIAAVTPPH